MSQYEPMKCANSWLYLSLLDCPSKVQEWYCRKMVKDEYVVYNGQHGAICLDTKWASSEIRRIVEQWAEGGMAYYVRDESTVEA